MTWKQRADVAFFGSFGVVHAALAVVCGAHFVAGLGWWQGVASAWCAVMAAGNACVVAESLRKVSP